MILIISLLSALLQGFISPAFATTGCNAVGWDGSFSDVYGCSLYYSAITWLHDEGFAEGIQETIGGKRSYQPNREINRAEFTKLVLLVSGEQAPLPECTKAPFPDVPVNAWFAPYVCRAKEKGIISGFPDGTFKPDIPVNYANAAKILVKSFNVPVNDADDHFSNEETIWFRKYTEALRKKHVTAESIDHFADNLTRGEMAEMLFRLKTGQNSFETERDEDAGNLGMGYGPYDFDSWGFDLDEPVPPFIFTPVSRSITEPFEHTMNLSGYAFSYVLPYERCGLSGLFQHCTPLLKNWQISFFTSTIPADALLAQMDRYYHDSEQTIHAFGDKDVTCREVGVEGEYTRTCVGALSAKKSIIVVMEYVDGSMAYTNVPGILAKEDIEAVFTRLLASAWFPPGN
jgi:hypothetical protein